MIRAVWNGKTIAESEDTIYIEGNHYFPPNSINKEYISNSDTHTSCYRKGKASYFTINVDGQLNIDSAWTYPEPREDAHHIKNYIAFWKGIQIEC